MLFALYGAWARRSGSARWRRPTAPAQPRVAAGLRAVRARPLADTPAAQRGAHPGRSGFSPGTTRHASPLWQAWTAAGSSAAIDAVTPVADGSPVAVEARFLEALSLIDLRDYAAASTRLASLQERAPSSLVLNNMGVVRLRSGVAPPDGGRPAWYFSQARTLDPLDPDYLFNLGYAYWLDGDPAAAAYWLREAVRWRRPTAEPRAAGPGAVCRGHSAEAARELALAQRLSSAVETLELKAGAALAPRAARAPEVRAGAATRAGIDAAAGNGGLPPTSGKLAPLPGHGPPLFDQEPRELVVLGA